VSLYADYIRETKDHTVVEDENGFYEYSLKENCVYLENIYVKPSARGFRIVKNYIRELGQIAKKHDLPCVTGVVNIAHHNANNILMLYLKNNVSVIGAVDNNIYVSIGTCDITTL
jgi:hypothetical protein